MRLAVRDLINQNTRPAKTRITAFVSPLTMAQLGDQFLRDFQDNEKTVPDGSHDLAEAVHGR